MCGSLKLYILICWLLPVFATLLAKKNLTHDLSTKRTCGSVDVLFAEKIRRSVSAPFISGDDFRAICKFKVDETFPVAEPNQYQWNKKYFEPSEVVDGDAIFVNLAYLDGFFKQYHPKIKALYILISYNHDFSAPGLYKNFLSDSQLFAWFTQNCDCIHQKMIQVPIGLSNKHWPHSRNHTELISNLQQQKNTQKKYLLYVNFNINTAPKIRQPIYDFFKNKPFCTCFKRTSCLQNYTNITQSKFVISPRGNGLDCHRTWETLYLGSYPVVKTSTLDPLYKDLPVVIVNDWSEVTGEFLEREYKELASRTYDFRKLYIDYWLSLIKQYQSWAKKYNVEPRSIL